MRGPICIVAGIGVVAGACASAPEVKQTTPPALYREAAYLGELDGPVQVSLRASRDPEAAGEVRLDVRLANRTPRALKIAITSARACVEKDGRTAWQDLRVDDADGADVPASVTSDAHLALAGFDSATALRGVRLAWQIGTARGGAWELETVFRADGEELFYAPGGDPCAGPPPADVARIDGASLAAADGH